MAAPANEYRWPGSTPQQGNVDPTGEHLAMCYRHPMDKKPGMLLNVAKYKTVSHNEELPGSKCQQWQNGEAHF